MFCFERGRKRSVRTPHLCTRTGNRIQQLSQKHPDMMTVNIRRCFWNYRRCIFRRGNLHGDSHLIIHGNEDCQWNTGGKKLIDRRISDLHLSSAVLRCVCSHGCDAKFSSPQARMRRSQENVFMYVTAQVQGVHVVLKLSLSAYVIATECKSLAEGYGRICSV